MLELVTESLGSLPRRLFGHEVDFSFRLSKSGNGFRNTDCMEMGLVLGQKE